MRQMQDSRAPSWGSGPIQRAPGWQPGSMPPGTRPFPPDGGDIPGAPPGWRPGMPKSRYPGDGPIDQGGRSFSSLLTPDQMKQIRQYRRKYRRQGAMPGGDKPGQPPAM